MKANKALLLILMLPLICFGQDRQVNKKYNPTVDNSTDYGYRMHTRPGGISLGPETLGAEYWPGYPAVSMGSCVTSPQAYLGGTLTMDKTVVLTAVHTYLLDYNFNPLLHDFYVYVYAHTGTYGTNGVPTGSYLARSDLIDHTTLSSAVFLDITATFSGANQITLTAGEHYCIIVNYGFACAEGQINVGFRTAGGYGGNGCYSSNGSTWSSMSSDLEFQVYGYLVN